MQNGIVVTSPTALSGQPSRAVRRTTDEELLEGIQDGNSGAMQILFARHHVRIHRFIFRLTGNAAVAEDLTSEVFITVWRHAAQFKARSSVSTWLLAIARYTSLSELRRKCRIENGLKRHSSDEYVAETPETALQTGDRRRTIRKCLAQLSREHRTIIDLVYYHGKSVSEVAEIVGIPPNTVKTRMYYARRRLAELLEGVGVVGVTS
jgi:RNA polymerase sigma-70 factor (ECF subfamily)